MVPGSEAFEGYSSEQEEARRREVEQAGGDVEVVDTQRELYPEGGREQDDDGDQVDPDDEGTREADPNGQGPVGEPPYDRKDLPWNDPALMESLRKMREAPDGAEGELSDGSEGGAGDLTPEAIDALAAEMAVLLGLEPDAARMSTDGVVQASRIGIGRAIDSNERIPMVAVMLEVDPPEGVNDVSMRVVRTLTPLKALHLAQSVLDIALSMITDGEEDEEPAAEESAPADPDPQGPEKLDTDE